MTSDTVASTVRTPGTGSVPGAKHRDAFGPHDEHARPADERLGGGAVEHVGGADEVGDEAVGRVLVDVAGLADLFDAAVVEHRQPVAQGQRLVLVVGHDDERDADLALDRLQLDLHLFAQFEVECAERLVEQQHPGPSDQCAGQRDALTLTARQLRRACVDASPVSRTMSSASAKCACGVRRARTPLTFSPYSTFWATVMWGNRAYSWKTVLTSRRRAGSAVTSTPPSWMVPAVGCSNPATMRSTVVLPEPGRAEDREQLAVADGQVCALDGDDLVRRRRTPCGRRSARSADRQRRQRDLRAAGRWPSPRALADRTNSTVLAAASSRISAFSSAVPVRPPFSALRSPSRRTSGCPRRATAGSPSPRNGRRCRSRSSG